MRQLSEPVLGWRVWRLRGRALASWGVAHVWQPGHNAADCLKPTNPCGAVPGQGCGCGFWGLYSVHRCISRAREDHGEQAPVLGLIRAWGEVGLHGTEGFRAQYAAPVCLFTDWIWDPTPSIRPETRRDRWKRALSRFLAGDFLVREPAADLEAKIREVAGEYGIPALSLPDALRLGALQELGVGTAGVS